MSLLYSEQLPMGWLAPDFKLKGTDDKEYSLSDFVSKKGLLIIFTCNHCPYAQAAWPLTIDLYNNFKDDIVFCAINPNDAENYTDDSFENMKSLVDELRVSFPYIRDETQEVAKEYKAQCTPDLYLFKIESNIPKLYYHGRINDNWQNPDQVKEENLKDALNGLAQDDEPPPEQPPSMGCSITWRE